jgi:predicted DNA binding protein
VEAFKINMPYEFHNAFYDAYYTTEIFKIVNSTAMQPKHYDPDFVRIQPRQPKRIIDFEGLILQFEKMYARKLTEEEQDMIKLAYKMGRTNQFLK